MQFLAIFIGGGLGSLARYGISLLPAKIFASNFPINTLLSNVIATAILALTASMLANSPNQFLKSMIMVGFCGGFSTFSAFSFETLHLIRDGNWLYAILNIIISVLLCLFVAYLLYKNV